jgi:undecaprenyl pyrophosphate synthase
LLKEFKIVSIEHIAKMCNEEANNLAQNASDYRPICDALTLDLAAHDWRKEIIDYLKNPLRKVSKQLRYKATKFVLLEDDLYHQTMDGVLLKCLGAKESKNLMGKIHEGVCGAHQ